MAFFDLTGLRFGRWIVMSYSWDGRWLCCCDCGITKTVIGRSLRNGTSVSCGCYCRDQKHDNVTDFSGQVFGRWTIVKRIGKVGSLWLCKCECGTERAVQSATFKRGRSKSCGCYRDDVAENLHKRHGLSRTKPYITWTGMKQRCYNPNFEQYKDYGGRGITVCDEWRESFTKFYLDMGDAPENMTLDRIDNNGNYEKTNCRWASPVQQAENRRQQSKEVRLTFAGITLTISDWAKRLNIPRTRIYSRLKSRWEIERVLSVD